MASPNVDMAVVRKLLELVDTHGLEELSVEQGDLAITVRAAGADTVPSTPGSVRPSRPVRQNPAAPTVPVEADRDIADITAPLVGIFYRGPSPDAPPFVEVGDRIDVGTEVGIIEAMKVFSPIPSEVAGEVVEIPAEDGKLVRQGEVLVRVRMRAEA